MTPPRVGLALSGGGSKGAFTVGVLRHLRQAWGVSTFPVVAGTSTGALIATLLVTNQWSRLVRVYGETTTREIVNPNYALAAGLGGTAGALFAAAVLGGRAVFDAAALAATIDANVDFDLVKARARETLVVYTTVDLTTGELVAFNNRDHDAEALRRALLASASMPVLTAPVAIRVGGEEHPFVDGGVREFLPLSAVFSSGVELTTWSRSRRRRP